MIFRTYPKISIVTPVFNNARFIENCVISVLNQGYPNLEYIVIDGGSTDGTAQIIEKYADQLAYYVSEKDQGQTHALNKGFGKATGDVLAWLNADEEYLPGILLKVGDAFSNNSKLDLLFGQRIVVDVNKNKIGTKYFPKMHPMHYMFYGRRVLPTDATFWSRRMHTLTGNLDEKSFAHLSMDYDWLLRMSIHVKRWKQSTDFFSKFTEREDRATRFANKKLIQKNGSLARKNIAGRYKISKLKLALGWFYASAMIRFAEGRLFNYPYFLSNIKHIIKNY